MIGPSAKRAAVASIWLSFALLLAGCGGSAVDAVSYSSPQDLSPAPLSEGERLRALATTSLVADAVRRVGGDRIELAVLMPPGIDPHSYEATSRDLRSVAEAQVVFANGLGLEIFLSDLLASSGTSAPVIEVSEGIAPLHVADVADSEPGLEPGEVDPHTWLDPINVARWVENITAALSALDPANAAEYGGRGDAYRAELEGLSAEIVRQLEVIPSAERLLVTDHDELGYFAARYDFDVIGAVIPGYSSAAEPSAQEIAALEDAIRGFGVRAIFVSQVVTPDLAQRVAGDTGVVLVNLHVHSLTGPGGEAPDYLSLMRYNVAAIVSALQPQAAP